MIRAMKGRVSCPGLTTRLLGYFFSLGINFLRLVLKKQRVGPVCDVKLDRKVWEQGWGW